MMHQRLSALFSAFALVAILFFSGCDPEDDGQIDPPPVDSDPVVTLISPENGYALAKRGETVSISFEIHDNEQLVAWEATEEWTSVTGTTALPETRINGEYAVLATTNSIRTINYTVPTQGIQVYTTIDIRAYATDNKGKRAMARFRINVIPDVNDTTQYQIQAYTGDTLFSITTGTNYNFDLLNRQFGNDISMPNPANQYLRESSIPPSIDHILTSPIWGMTDSVLVTTNESVFNYDELDYETVWEAFVTSNRIGMKTDPLSPGDVVILKLPNLPHYAVFRINSTEGVGGCGCMTFDYKYSYE